MSGAKETPRQKMIGMMYLVLTALLALNISKEVLDGFVKVENSLQQTQHSLSQEAEDTYRALEAKYASNQEKVAPFYDQAQEIREKSNELVRYIIELKARCLSTSEGDYEKQELEGFKKYLGENENGKDTTLNLRYIDKKDEYQELTRFMVGADPNNPEEGKWTANGLKLAVQNYRDYLMNLSVTDINGEVENLPPNTLKSLNERFAFEKELKDEKMVLWEVANFHKMPLAAAMPLMSKIIIDIKDAQEDAIGWLLNSTEAKSLKFSDVMGMAIPQSNYVFKGDTARANIILTAFDPTKRPVIYIDPVKWDGEDTTPLDYEGLGLEPLDLDSVGQGLMAMSTRGMSLGQYQYKGVIKYQGPEGEMLSAQFKTPTFTIAEPSLVVSPTKMNVFYRNLENPVRISVAGIASDKLNVRISGSHKIRPQSDGSFIVQPANNLDKEAIISVNAEMPDGSTMNLGSNTFRVKDIPDPVAMWSGKKSSDGSISVRDILGFNPLVAKMEKFDFELRPSVKSFTLKVTKDGTYLEEKSNSFDFTSDMKELLRSPKRGTTIYFEDIVVSMPGGEKRKIAGLTLKVKN